jgi:drug/metabolite transporter (DMT)-like permease
MANHNLASYRSRCIVFAIASSILSSVATVFKVQGVAYIDPLIAASVGVLFAGVISLAYLALRSDLPSWKSLVEVRKPLLMLTLCRPVLSNTIFSVGLFYTSAVEAVFLTKMEPYLVIFWVWLLDGKRPTGNHLALLLVHIIGAILLSAGNHKVNHGVAWFGDLIIVCSVVSAALSYRYAPQVTTALKPLQTAAVVEALGGIITLPLILLAPPLTFSDQEMVGWMYLGVHSVLFYVLAISLLYASLGGIEGWLSSALRATGPLVAAPVAVIFLGEELTATQVVGALVVLVTSGLISKRDTGQQKRARSEAKSLDARGIRVEDVCREAQRGGAKAVACTNEHLSHSVLHVVESRSRKTVS